MLLSKLNVKSPGTRVPICVAGLVCGKQKGVARHLATPFYWALRAARHLSAPSCGAGRGAEPARMRGGLPRPAAERPQGGSRPLEALALLEVVEAAEHARVIAQLRKLDAGGLKDDRAQLACKRLLKARAQILLAGHDAAA